MPSFKFLHYAWIILSICFVNLFINYAVQLGYGVILPEMIKELNFSRTAAGTIFNFYLIVYIVLTPITGYLPDRLGVRRVTTFLKRSSLRLPGPRHPFSVWEQ